MLECHYFSGDTLIDLRPICKLVSSSHRRNHIKKVVFEKFGKFTETRLCRSLFFNKVNFIK